MSTFSKFAGSSQLNLYTLMPSIAFSAMKVSCREVGGAGGSATPNEDTINKIVVNTGAYLWKA